MRKIQILYTIPNFITAGSGQVLFNILTRLDPSRFSPTICVQKKGGVFDVELERRGYNVLEQPFSVPAKPYISLPLRALKVAEKFREFHFDLWHSFHYSDDYSEPIIARLSGARGWIYTKKSMMWGSRAWMLRSLLATRIVADNREMPLLFFNKYGLAKKTRVIPHGIPLAEFSPANMGSRHLRDRYGIPSEAFLVGCVAHLVPVKGHSILIEAISNLDNVYLFLAGRPLDETYADQLHAQVSGLGLSQRVHFLGNLEDIPDFLSQMDILVLPSKNEAFGVVLIEAMACGKPCIASDISGPRQIIEDGVSGFLVPPEDPKTLAEFIGRLHRDMSLRLRMGSAARNRAVDYFNIDREVLAHEALYEELMTSMRKE